MLSASARRVGGNSLIEVLVGLLLMSFGLLSVAALQARLASHSDAAQLRARAWTLAQDLAERLRANPDGVAGGFYDGTWHAWADATDAADSRAAVTCATPCGPAEVAQADRAGWSAGAIRLPGAAVSVTRTPGSGTSSLLDIRLAWHGPVDGGAAEPPEAACPVPDGDGGPAQCLHLRVDG
ncbi:MAG: type IV pilus modification protein PilV [Burkholderiaceae bacterium]|nr:type IV pilus modification protein PilV [Burkholderiaceae bacterium]